MTSLACGTDSGALQREYSINFIYESTVQIGDRYSPHLPPTFGELSRKGNDREYHHLVHDLLNSGHDASVRTDHGLTPLHLAAFDGNMAALRTILAHNPDVNAATYQHGLTPLHIATALDRKDMVRVLVKHGADQRQTDKSGWHPIHYASHSGFSRIKRLLHRLEIKPNEDETRKETISLGSLDSFQSIGQSSYTGSFYSLCDKHSSDLITMEYSSSLDEHTSIRDTETIHENVKVTSILSPPMDEIFALFDRSKDGKISMAELTDVIRFLKIPASASEIEAMVRAVDVNENGVVDYEEFLELLKRHERDHSAPAGDLPGILFDIFDADGNGVIDRGEITRVMKKLGVTITDEDLTEMLREADINGDGQIDKTEFQKLFENLKPSLPSS